MASHGDVRHDDIGKFLENGTTSTRSHPLALTQLMLATRIVAIRDRLAATRNLESVR
jgi:hypothetical protein